MLSATAAVGLVVFLATPKPTSAQDMQIYKDQVIGYLNKSQKLQSALDRGFRVYPGGLKTGYIYVGKNNYQDAFFEVEPGYAYLFVGKCDEDCTDMDFVLYDGDGDKIDEDTRPDDTPVVSAFARRAETYRLRATTPKCNAPIGCYWAVQAVYK
jgi:hypothetical protein